MPPSTRCETAVQLADLANLSLEALRQRWAEIFGTATPAAARSDYLIRALAFQIQLKAHGGHSSSVARRIKKLLSGSGDVQSTTTRRQALRPGTRLLREWQGKAHDVEVVDSGYRYCGKNYRSLSEIARLITGTRWSGPSFFGLKGTASKATKGTRPTYVVDLGSRSRSSTPLIEQPLQTEADHAG